MSNRFSKIPILNLRNQVVEQIRAAIIEGRLKPGDHIREIDLTSELGVSRTPVREALILLEREGLIVSETNRGSFVRQFSEQDIHDIFSMRINLENFAGELIINKLDERDISYLEALIERQKLSIDTEDTKSIRRIDMSFHEYLVEKSEHPLLIRSWQELVAQVAALLHIRKEVIPDYDEYKVIVDHQSIVDAYKNRNLEDLRKQNSRINKRVAKECCRSVE